MAAPTEMTAMTSASDEFGLIARHLAPLSRGEPGAFMLTDDAAELAVEPGKRLVATCDAMVAGIHFPADSAPALLARRLMRVNLSDLAAKGARPRAYLLVLVMPRRTPESWLADFAHGLAEDQQRYAVTLLGGDMSTTDGPLMLSISFFGEVEENKIILRSGAKPEDDVYVSGTIGDAGLGLAVIQGRLSIADPADRAFLVDRFNLPAPRVEVGRALAGIASAAADVSDGLIADLGHICDASGVTADLDLAQIPASPAARRLVTNNQPLAVKLLTSGDDYEIVFTAPRSVSARIGKIAAQSGVALTRVGRIRERDTASGAVVLRDPTGHRIEVGDGGYRHF